MRRLTLIACLLAAAPVAAHADGNCQGQVRDLERDMTLRSNRIGPQDRLQDQQRLSRAEGMCPNDSRTAGQEMENLRRDIIQQANRPPMATTPGVTSPGAAIPGYDPGRR